MLKVENISTGYGKKQVLFNVSFEIMKGEIVLLAGNNGSGKSTLLKVLYGLLPQWNMGQIFLEGEDITGKHASTLLKKGLIYIPQKNNLFEDLSVKENLEMAGLSLNRRTLAKNIEYSFSIFTSLEPLQNRLAMKLSGGERQLLSIAMATLHHPRVILYDELLNGLSISNAKLVINSLITLHKLTGTTILIAEHRIKEVSEIADKIIGLKLGEIYYESKIGENINYSHFKSLFV